MTTTTDFPARVGSACQWCPYHASRQAVCEASASPQKTITVPENYIIDKDLAKEAARNDKA